MTGVYIRDQKLIFNGIIKNKNFYFMVWVLFPEQKIIGLYWKCFP